MGSCGVPGEVLRILLRLSEPVRVLIGRIAAQCFQALARSDQVLTGLLVRTDGRLLALLSLLQLGACAVAFFAGVVETRLGLPQLAPDPIAPEPVVRIEDGTVLGSGGIELLDVEPAG